MSETKRGYREQKRDATAAVTFTQRIRVQSPQRRVFISQVSVSDDTTAAAVARIGVEAGGTFYPITSQICTTAALVYDVFLMTWLYEGESLRVDWSSVVVADVLSVNVIGNQEFE